MNKERQTMSGNKNSVMEERKTGNGRGKSNGDGEKGSGVAGMDGAMDVAAMMAMNEKLQARIEELEMNAWIDAVLTQEGARNPKAVWALLQTDTIRDEESVKKQLDELKEKEAYLFHESVGEGRFGQPPMESRDRGDDAFMQGFGR